MNPLKDKHEEVLRAVGISDGVDVSIEAVGVTPTAQMSVDCVKNCGRVIWVGNADQIMVGWVSSRGNFTSGGAMPLQMRTFPPA